MATVSSCESILCPVCRKRPIRSGVVCGECYGQFGSSPVPREAVTRQDDSWSVRVRTMILVVGLTAVSLSAARQSLLLGTSLGVVLLLTLMLGSEQIRQRKHLGLPVTIREEGICFLTTALVIGLSFAVLMFAFAGAAMIVIRLVQPV